MKKLFAAILFLAMICPAFAQTPDTRYFELRIYYPPQGKLDNLIERFQKNTTRIFEKHGMENIGYWVPVTNTQNALYYILAYPDAAARKKSWEGFMADPEWASVSKKSEENGKLVDSVKSVFMKLSDILPMNTASSGGERVFELRTYTCLPGRLPNLLARFKDHTIAIFKKHHMENVAYFVSEEKDGGQPKLVYILAHKSQEESVKSWNDFRTDPEWIAARDASEKDGKIVAKVESVFLKPLSFSKLK